MNISRDERRKLDSPWLNPKVLNRNPSGEAPVNRKSSVAANNRTLGNDSSTDSEHRINARAARRMSRRRDSALRSKVSVVR